MAINGFVNTKTGFDAADLIAVQAQAEDIYIAEAPPVEGVVIEGLQSGATNTIADQNSATIQSYLDAGGTLELIIPDSSAAVDGVWYTSTTIYVQADTTITWVGKLHQLASAVEPYSNEQVVRVSGGNVTLNNPLISQRYVQVVIDRHGTHTCLAIYDQGLNCTVNGGILEWGAHNAFQGGRDNTVFNDTIFRDCGEHLVYSSGTYNDRLSIGLTFNDCLFERPGNNAQEYMVEANHIQLRKFADVEMNRCIVRGQKKTYYTAFGINATDIDGLTLNDCLIEDYTAAAVNYRIEYTTLARGCVINDTEFNPKSSPKDALRVTNIEDAVICNRVTVNAPYRITKAGNDASQVSYSEWNDCIFKMTSAATIAANNSDCSFDNCTWDASDSTASRAMTQEAGSAVSFTGTQTKIDPTNGQSFNWSPIP